MSHSHKITQETLGSITWYIPEVEGAEAILKRLKEIKEPLGSPDFHLLKKGRKKLFGLLDLLGKEDAYLKAWCLPSLSLRLKHLFAPSRARKELELALEASSRGVATPTPLAAGEKRSLGLVVESYFIVKKIDSAINLRDFLLNAQITHLEKKCVIEAFARLVRESHRMGLLQTDLALNNFLVNLQNSPFDIYLLDLERAELHANLPEDKVFWVLAKLNRAGIDFSLSDRMRFLRAYAGEPGQYKSKYRLWAKPLEKDTHRILKKDAQRLRQNSIIGERGFKIYKSSPPWKWKGYMLEGLSAEEILDLLNNFKQEGSSMRRGNAELSQCPGILTYRGKRETVVIYRFTASAPSLVFTAWQAANGLAKGGLRVRRAFAAFERDHMGYLLFKDIPAARDIRSFLQVHLAGETPALQPDGQTAIWHLAKFLSRLHNFGTLSWPLGEGDVLYEGAEKPLLYLGHPFNFSWKKEVTLQERELDLSRLEDYLGLRDEEKRFFRDVYHRQVCAISNG